MSKRLALKKDRGFVFQSRMTQILNVDLTAIFRLVKHILIVGGSGSGKTSALLLLTKLMYDNNETIVWRDDTSLEFLSLRNFIPWKVFLPEGCELHYKHPNVEYAYFNPWNLDTLFAQIDPDKGNAVVFDLFSFDVAMFIDFWSKFFYGLYKWKRRHIKMRISFATDEINDLAPSIRRGYIPRQLILSSNIYLSMKKFRKVGVRLVASTHAYGDVHKPVREAFNYYMFRHMDAESVPNYFQRYAKVVERLKINEMIILDEAKSFNKMTVEELVKPKSLKVKWDGEIQKQTEVKRTEMDEWKKRFAIAVSALNKLGLTFEELTKPFGYKSKAGIQQFIRKKLSEEDNKTVEAILTVLASKEEA